MILRNNTNNKKRRIQVLNNWSAFVLSTNLFKYVCLPDFAKLTVVLHDWKLGSGPATAQLVDELPVAEWWLIFQRSGIGRGCSVNLQAVTPARWCLQCQQTPLLNPILLNLNHPQPSRVGTKRESNDFKLIGSSSCMGSSQRDSTVS